jgi:hypothetical protein
MRTHILYEFDVEFTQVIDHRDQCGDHTNYSENPGTKVTIRVVMQQYSDELAEAWLNRQFRHAKAFKVLERRSHNVSIILTI